jgi:hypothetical protein
LIAQLTGHLRKDIVYYIAKWSNGWATSGRLMHSDKVAEGPNWKVVRQQTPWSKQFPDDEAAATKAGYSKTIEFPAVA